MCKRIPSRVWVGMMIFWGTFVNYMFRSHYQISLLAMMAPRKNETVSDYGPRLHWTYHWEQQSISAIFYGMAIISLPAGVIINRLGPWHILFWSTTIMTISSDCIVPMAIYVGPGAVVGMRAIVGMMVGLQYPALQNLASSWAPPDEKGIFMSCLMGSSFGSIITLPATGLIIKGFGWSWSFYYMTIVSVLYCSGLFFFVADRPRDYRWIRPEEVEMIEHSLEGSVSLSLKRGRPPYIRMFSSRPFWALVVGQFGSLYNVFLALTTAPQFFKRRLKFSLETTSAVASLPHIARLSFGFSYGLINDWLRRKGVSKATSRRIFTVFSHIMAGFCLLLFLVIGDCAVCAVSLLVIRMLFNGAAVASVLINPNDLAPNWSGTIYSIMNFFGSWGGCIAPLLVSELTQENTVEEWASVFAIGGCISILTGIFFMFFGEFDMQPWNDPDERHSITR